MNLRVFKKDIEYFIGEFIEDCDLFVLLNPQQDSEEINRISCRSGKKAKKNRKENLPDHLQSGELAGARTLDHRLKRAMLYRLSYQPTHIVP